MRRREFIGAIAGAGAAWTIAARAQQPAMPVIGFLSAASDAYADAFRQGLSEQGYVEGRNVQILYRYAEFRNDRLPELAADLVRHPVAVIFTTGSQASMLAAKSVTAITPIVFVTGTDPVELGLVASLNRPGGNLTGVYFLDQAVNAKRLQLLHEVVPTASMIGFLVNPTSPPSQVDPEISETENAARLLGVRLVILNASNPSEIEVAFASLAGRRIGALFVIADALFNTQRDQLAALAARNAVPAIYPYREHVDAGGLMSYGVSLSDAHRLAGTYVGQILKGDKPANLPVQQSTKFELVINLKTAKALGVAIPETLLATADKVYPDYPRKFLTRRRTTGVVTAQAEARASMEEALPDPTNRNPPAQQPASLERGKRRLLIRRFWSTAIGLAAVGKNKKADLGSGRGTFRSKMS